MQTGVAAILSFALLLLADGFRKVKNTDPALEIDSEDGPTRAAAQALVDTVSHDATALDAIPWPWCLFTNVKCRQPLKATGIDSEDGPPTRDSLKVGQEAEDLDTPGTAIVNGTQAPACKWKWQVGLASRGSRSTFCGGSLISSTWVVTAQHCVANGRNIDVWAGSNRAGQGTSRTSSRIVQHRSHDIALIQLSSPMPLGNCLNTVPLARSALASGTECWITGWGRLYHNGPSSPTLMEASTQVVDTRSCRQQMGGGQTIYDGDVCVVGRMNGRPTSACNGDSGGPLVCRAGSGWQLHGATSWGKNCRGITVYAGTFANRNWINSNMR